MEGQELWKGRSCGRAGAVEEQELRTEEGKVGVGQVGGWEKEERLYLISNHIPTHACLVPALRE